MQKKLKLLMATLCLAQLATAQTDNVKTDAQGTESESAFTFTEAQLGEDDDMSQNVTIINSNSNVYASQVGYQFSLVRFRYRAANQKYNDVYINNSLMNDMETGQFRYSLVGGLNQQTKNQEFALPFESNYFSVAGMAGSNNYNFRPAQMPVGHRVTVSGTNRNYTLRGMYTYNSGLNSKGWAYSANITYRWSDMNTANVEGTFYNSLSYFFGVQKVADSHSFSLVTWGNPTERASQGASTDEMYWIANNRHYNPYWGYEKGKKRNSRIVNDFAPTAMFTWDWTINDNTRLTTTLTGKYSMYKNTSLDYNNADNPSPDYWKNMPSAYYNVWDQDNVRNNDYTPDEWKATYEYLTASVRNRQIDWDRLYAANKSCNDQQIEAMYFVKAKHNDALTLQLNSALNKDLGHNRHLSLGLGLGANNGRHYMTVDDLLGGVFFYNRNNFAMSTYGMNADEVEYDLNNSGKLLNEGDKYRYDYFINLRKATLWGAYTQTFRRMHFLFGAKTNYVAMQRDGKMRNGMAKENSYGKSGTARFLDGGVKTSLTMNLGKGNTVSLGAGAEYRAPQASTAFAAPEVNNDFVLNLKNERIFSSEIGYALNTSWLTASLSAYLNYMDNVTEWQNYYFDDNNSFTYVSLTGIKKAAYGAELGAKIKVTSALDIVMLGTVSEAKYLNDCQARYMVSKRSEYVDTKVYSKRMRESGTPLTAASIGVSYHSGGWFIDLSGNYYDRIYLSWSPSLRYENVTAKRQSAGDDIYDNDGNLKRSAFAQAEGKGGFVLDGSIGRNIRLRRGSVSVNLTLSNLLNNTKICTGGYEQSRSDYTKNNSGGYDKRIYLFSQNPKKFYAFGTNAMLNIAYKF